MKTKYILIIFAVTALLQAAAPLKMVYDSEMTERHGAEYKFSTAPVDPTDPFRGKYITLTYDIATVPTTDTTWVRDEPVYALLGKDKDGFASIAAVSRNEPEAPADYIKAKVQYYYGKDLHIDLPFDVYYMEEGKAYEAETGYTKFNNRTANLKPAYALVAVKDGRSVLKDVIIDDIPIRDYVLREREKKQETDTIKGQ